MSFAVFVPVFNSSEAVRSVIEDLSSIEWPSEIRFYFIDNCSVDHTPSILRKEIENYKLNNVSILQNITNIGLGGTQKVAFRYASERSFEFVAIFHGDYQPTAIDLQEGISKIKELSLDALLGSRFKVESKRHKYNSGRLFGNLMLNMIYSIRFQRLITDLGSGLNIYRTDSLPEFNNLPNDLSFNCHLLISQLKKGSKIEWFAITWRHGLAPSTLRKFKLGFLSIKALFSKQNTNYGAIHKPTTLWTNE
jgi:dolichol-phosphate mannosyltransferase